MIRRSMPWFGMVVLVLVLVGCGSTEEAQGPVGHTVETATKPADPVEGPEWLQAAMGQIEQLDGEARTEAEGYQSQITRKFRELEELKAKLSKMKPADLLTEDGRKLATRSEELVEDLDSLRDELQAVLGQAAQ